MPDRASGFCIYNDIAVGIRWLLDHGATKVAYVDVDVHHGDGVEKIFYDDPRVLTISLHETGQTLFPGTGFAQDVRGPRRPGQRGQRRPPARYVGRRLAARLPRGRARTAPGVRAGRSWSPSTAATATATTRSRDLMLSVDGQRASYLALHDLAHEVCDGRWVVTGGGGYALVEVVPRAWTHLLSVVGGQPLDVSTADARRVARARPRAPRSARAACADRRPGPRLPRLVGGLRPRDLAGPDHQRDPGGDLPVARPRPAPLSRIAGSEKVKSEGFSTRHARFP